MAKTSSSTPTREEFVSFKVLMNEIMNLKDSYVFLVDKNEVMNSPERIRDQYKVVFEKMWDERLDIIQNRISKEATYKWFFNKDKSYDLSRHILKNLPNKKEFIRLEVRKIDSAIKSIKGKTSVLAKSKKSINNRKLLQNFLINEIGILNNYTVNYFNQLWSNEDIIFRAAIAIGSYIYPVRDSMPNNSYDKLVNTLENLVNLCGDCQDIHGDTKLLVALHLQNALSTLKIKEPLGISERKNKKIKEKKLIEKLIEILLNNGGIAFNGNEIVHYVEGGKALAISKGIMESNNELRRGVIDGVAGGNIDFYDTHDENNESINKSPSEFEIFINKPHLKKVTEYKGKSVAVLVDKNLRIKYIEMVSKLQVEEDIKRIVFHDEISKILENSHENSEADKEKLNKLNLPQNIKEEIFDAYIMNEDETYCTVKRSEKFKLNEAFMFIKTVLSSLDYYDLKDDEIKKQIKHQICSRKLYEAYLDEISFSARSRNNRLPFSEDEFRFLTF